eukprot:1976766-Prorocentrum_lima.AAC.1
MLANRTCRPFTFSSTHWRSSACSPWRSDWRNCALRESAWTRFALAFTNWSCRRLWWGRGVAGAAQL